MAFAPSSRIFCTTLPKTLNGGKRYKNLLCQFCEKASTAQASGSGRHETYGLNWWFSLDANISTSGFPQRLIHMSKIVELNCHSVLSLKVLLSLSAPQLSEPGMWVAVSQIFLTRHQVHISRAIALH